MVCGEGNGKSLIRVIVTMNERREMSNNEHRKHSIFNIGEQRHGVTADKSRKTCCGRFFYCVFCFYLFAFIFFEVKWRK